MKSPTFGGKPAQVGPARSRARRGAAAKDDAILAHLTRVLGIVEAIAKIKVPLDGLHSTLGRHAARAVMCARNVEILEAQWKLLLDNVASGDVTTFEKPVFPEGEISGFGFHEAPRGLLSHWVVIEKGIIKNYQAVVPTTWNAAPRNEQDQRGPYEASLLDTPIADPERPLEVLRTIHSFDPVPRVRGAPGRSVATRHRPGQGPLVHRRRVDIKGAAGRCTSLRPSSASPTTTEGTFSWGPWAAPLGAARRASPGSPSAKRRAAHDAESVTLASEAPSRSEGVRPKGEEGEARCEATRGSRRLPTRTSPPASSGEARRGLEASAPPRDVLDVTSTAVH